MEMIGTLQRQQDAHDFFAALDEDFFSDLDGDDSDGFFEDLSREDDHKYYTTFTFLGLLTIEIGSPSERRLRQGIIKHMNGPAFTNIRAFRNKGGKLTELDLTHELAQHDQFPCPNCGGSLRDKGHALDENKRKWVCTKRSRKSLRA